MITRARAKQIAMNEQRSYSTGTATLRGTRPIKRTRDECFRGGSESVSLPRDRMRSEDPDDQISESVRCDIAAEQVLAPLVDVDPPRKRTARFWEAAMTQAMFGDETCQLQIQPSFDGQFGACRQTRLFGSKYLPCSEIHCSGHRKLYLARLPEHIAGGHKDGKGQVTRERLGMYLLANGVDVFPRETFMRDAVLGARFFWIGADAPYTLTRAVISYRTDEMLSLTVTGYSSNGKQKHLMVHRILAFTFLLTPRFYTRRWSEALHVDHMNGSHGDNIVENLQLLVDGGKDGHGAKSKKEGCRGVTLCVISWFLCDG